jgi:cofilin
MPNITGITVSSNAITQYQTFHLSKDYFMIFRFSDDFREIIVDRIGRAGSTYEDMMTALPPHDVRYVVIQYEFTRPDEELRSKTILIRWVPDTAPVRLKMISAGSQSQLQEALVGISIIHAARDQSEISEAALLDRIHSRTH